MVIKKSPKLYSILVTQNSIKLYDYSITLIVEGSGKFV